MKKNQNGQILLVVILVMVVALTVGLSVATRNISTIRNTSDEQSSQKAFSAAEAGLEKALALNPPPGSVIPGTFPSANSSYTTSVSGLSGLTTVPFENVQVDEPADLWLSDYPTYAVPWSGRVRIYWGDPSIADCSNAAIEIIILSGTIASPTVTHDVYDPCTTRGNNFKNVAGGGGGPPNYKYKNTGNIRVNNGLIMRMIPLYVGTKIAAVSEPPANPFPSQGTLITSVGISGTAQRKIQTLKGYPKIPNEMFSFVLFSPK